MRLPSPPWQVQRSTQPSHSSSRRPPRLSRSSPPASLTRHYRLLPSSRAFNTVLSLDRLLPTPLRQQCGRALSLQARSRWNGRGLLPAHRARQPLRVKLQVGTSAVLHQDLELERHQDLDGEVPAKRGRVGEVPGGKIEGRFHAIDLIAVLRSRRSSFFGAKAYSNFRPAASNRVISFTRRVAFVKLVRSGLWLPD
jgi:hypothetical protein